MSSCELAKMKTQKTAGDGDGGGGGGGMDIEALHEELDKFREDLLDDHVLRLIEEKLED